MTAHWQVSFVTLGPGSSQNQRVKTREGGVGPTSEHVPHTPNNLGSGKYIN